MIVVGVVVIPNKYFPCAFKCHGCTGNTNIFYGLRVILTCVSGVAKVIPKEVHGYQNGFGGTYSK